MYKIANIRRYISLKIVISLMYLSLDEKRCTFYVNYFFIISLSNFSNLSTAKINSVKFSIKIQLRILVPRNLQFLDLPDPNICSAKFSALKVMELCEPKELFYSNIQDFISYPEQLTTIYRCF